ncbi:hypothetical protein [Nocardioides sp.]|uniref:hypothetical protein n=1 Tax=Nocardioides sp. TaxID=35761 RepID=UPI0035636FF9
MSSFVVEAPVSAGVRRAIARGRAAYEKATASTGPSDVWDNRVIDQAIYAFVRQGHPFSANDFRDLLPKVRKCLISRRLIQAQKDGLVVWTGRVTPSTLRSTKAAHVNVYEPLPDAVARLRGRRR